MARQENLNVIISAKDSASPVLRNISQSFDKFEKKIDKARMTLQRFKQSVDVALRYTTMLTGAIAGAVTATTYFGAKVEKSFQTARTMMKMTNEEAQKMQKSIQQLAINSGKSLNELNEALYMLGSAGIQSKDAIDVLRTTTMSAIAGATDMTTTFMSAISIINAYNMSIKDLTRVYALQFQTVKKGLMTYQQLAVDFGSVVPAARQLGVALEDALAGYAALTRMGLSSAESATATAMAFLDLGEKVEKLEKIGVRLYDEYGKFRGLLPIIKDLRKAFEGLTDQQKQALLEQIGFEIRAARAIVNWVNNYEMLADTVQGLTGDSEALAEAYELQTQSMSFLLDKLKTSLEVVNQAFFNAIRSDVVKWVNQISAGLQRVASWIDKNKDLISDTLPALFRLLGTILGLLVALKLFASGAEILTYLLKPMNMLIMAVVWAVYELWKALYKGNEYSKNFGGFIMFIYDKLKAFVEFIKTNVIPGIQAEVDNLVKLFNKSGPNIFDWILGTIIYLGKQLWYLFELLGKWLSDLLHNVLKNILDEFKGDLEKFLKGQKIVVVPVVIREGKGTPEQPAGSGTEKQVKQEYKVEPADETTKNFLKLASAIAEGVKDFTLNLLADLSKLPQWLKDVFEGAKENWQVTLQPVLDFAKQVSLEFQEDLSAISEWIRNGVKDITLNLQEGTANVWDWLLNGVQTVKIQLEKAWGKGFEWLEKGFQLVKIQLQLVLPKREKETGEAVEPTAAITPVKPIYLPEPTNKKLITDFSFSIQDATNQLQALNTQLGLTGEALSTSLSKVSQSYRLEQAPAGYKPISPFAVFFPLFDFLGALAGALGLSTSTFSLGAAPVFGFQEGGFTGKGSLNEVAGVVHKGEYVVPAWLVRKYPELIALLEEKRIKGYQEGGLVGTVLNYLFGGRKAEADTLVKDVDLIKEVVTKMFDLIKETNPEMADTFETLASKLGIALPNLDNKWQESWFSKGMQVWTKIANFLQKMEEKGKGKEGEGEGEGKEGETYKEKWQKFVKDLQDFWNGFKAGFEGFIQIAQTMDFGAVLSGILQAGLQGLGGLLQSIGGALITILPTLQNVSEVLSFFNTILNGIFEIIGSVIDSAFKPFVQILASIGNLIGTLLLPLLEPFLGILQALAQVFAWAYNTIFVPVGRGLYFVFGIIGNAFNRLYNVISEIVKKLTLGLINMGKRTVKSWDEIWQEAQEKIQPIDIGDFEAGKEATQEYVANVTRSGPETVYNIVNLYANESFILDHKSAFYDFLAEAVQELIDTGQIKFA